MDLIGLEKQDQKNPQKVPDTLSTLEKFKFNGFGFTKLDQPHLGNWMSVPIHSHQSSVQPGVGSLIAIRTTYLPTQCYTVETLRN